MGQAATSQTTSRAALVPNRPAGPTVLDSQPPEVRSFLVRTAVLERLTGPLCDALLETSGSADTLAELERDYIMKVLAAEGGNKTRAAQRLGLDRKTLYRKLEEYAASGGEPGPGGGESES